jgi:hypothetical protein
MVHQKVSGDVGDATVRIKIEAEDEQLANLLYADIVGRVDELKQIVDHNIPVEETVPPMGANWAESEYANPEVDD